MKIEWDDRIKKPVMIFEEDDFYNANEILKTINTKGWLILQGYFQSQREMIVEKGKEHARTKLRRDLCDNLFAFLDGFDACMRIPDRVVEQAKVMKDAIEKSKKEKHDEAEALDD